MRVTDMILEVGDLDASSLRAAVELTVLRPAERAGVLALVRAEHPSFSEFYEAQPASTDVCALTADGRLVGSVLLEAAPAQAESPTDAALAALLITAVERGRGLASAGIVACVTELAARGATRVIAEWVASVPLYERLGFRVWRVREQP